MAKRIRQNVDAAVVQQAMAALGIDVPVRAWKVEKGRLVLLLATGEQRAWEVKTKTERGLPGRQTEESRQATRCPGGDAAEVER